MGWEAYFMPELRKCFLDPDRVPPDEVRRAVYSDGPQQTANHRMQAAALRLRCNPEHGQATCSLRLGDDFATGHQQGEILSTTYEPFWLLPVSFVAWEAQRLRLWPLYLGAVEWIRHHVSLLELCSRGSDGEVFVAGSRCGMKWNRDQGTLLRWFQRRPTGRDLRVIQRARHEEVPYQHLGIVASAFLEKDIPTLGALPILRSPLEVARYGPDDFVAYSPWLEGPGKPGVQWEAAVTGGSATFMREDTKSARSIRRHAPRPMTILPGEPVILHRLGPIEQGG